MSDRGAMEFMEKKFIKQIISVINDNDMDFADYITKVKYIIFFISKILYACKLNNIKLENDNFSYIMSKSVLNGSGMGIFNLYSSFDLKLNDVEEKLYRIMCSSINDKTFDNFLPAKLYELLLTPKEKKSMGQVYTPLDIIDKMLSQSFNIKKINSNMHILDPSCGGGYFLIEAFKKIRSSSEFDNFDDKDRYILENIIYGIDIDEFSIFLTKMGLLFLSNCTDVKLNILNLDFLIDIEESGSEKYKNYFDLIIGNPPYIGHKQTDKNYRSLLKKKYGEVFYDKSDISYCFFKRSTDFLNIEGVVCFITSRYFMEAMYADKLREFLKKSFRIVSISDYSGIRIFKGAMVSPLVLTLCNREGNERNEDTFSYIKHHTDTNKQENFHYEQKKLKNSGWVILNNKEEELFNRIESISNTYISDVCSIKQGIITGYDKAFIVTEQEIERYKLENNLLKKWIKNSNITKSCIKYNNLYLIYSNMILHEEDYPNVINYLKPFKDRLMNRRECKNGIRKWYELQWGRIQADFDSPKILFPYKSNGNNFFYDKSKFYCSADIYFINDISSEITYEYLQNYLNSNIFEFYFKCIAKKVGPEIYEYYPNKLNSMKIYLPCGENAQKISQLGKFSIDNFLEKVFNINGEEEKTIIYKYLSKKGDNAK